ncbi:MAG: flagellar basal body-associated FliL family protein [Desulfobacca sp.]|nr:flagellar basal body-associated FliL family protein [Desulfobacca sp.]
MAKTETPPVSEQITPNKKKTKLIIMLALSVLGIILVGGGYWSYSKYMQSGESEAVSAVHGSLGGEAISGKSESIALEPFLVNLADPGGRRYLKVKIDLEVNRDFSKEIEKSLPKIRDAIILLLSSKTYDDLATLSGKQALRQEIIAKLRTLPGGRAVMGAYFLEFVAQ